MMKAPSSSATRTAGCSGFAPATSHHRKRPRSREISASAFGRHRLRLAVPPASELPNAISLPPREIYGEYGVNDIASRRRGEIVGFLGPNGAGKSTTMRILTGYLPATSGSVRICGVPVATQPDEIKRRIGYMPENNPLPEDMRVSEYMYFRGRLKEVPRRKLGPRIDEVLEVCDLKRVRHKIIGQLSKGYRQRVGIAEAILAEPPVIIMDEPTIGLDPHQILIVRDLIASLRGRMTVISSHSADRDDLRSRADHNQGRVVARAPPLRREIVGHSSYLTGAGRGHDEAARCAGGGRRNAARHRRRRP